MQDIPAVVLTYLDYYAHKNAVRRLLVAYWQNKLHEYQVVLLYYLEKEAYFCVGSFPAEVGSWLHQLYGPMLDRLIDMRHWMKMGLADAPPDIFARIENILNQVEHGAVLRCSTCADPLQVTKPAYFVRQLNASTVVFRCPECLTLIVDDAYGWKGSGMTFYANEQMIAEYLVTGRLPYN